jgi:hypothetical protein
MGSRRRHQIQFQKHNTWFTATGEVQRSKVMLVLISRIHCITNIMFSRSCSLGRFVWVLDCCCVVHEHLQGTNFVPQMPLYLPRRSLIPLSTVRLENKIFLKSILILSSDLRLAFQHSWDSNHWCWHYISNHLVPELRCTHLANIPHFIMYYYDSTLHNVLLWNECAFHHGKILLPAR